MAVADGLGVGVFGLAGEVEFGVAEQAVSDPEAFAVLPARGAGGDLQAADLLGRQRGLAEGVVLLAPKQDPEQAREFARGGGDRDLVAAASADALYIVDPQGRIRFLNPAAVRTLGYEDERQLLGRPSHDTIHYLSHDGSPFPAAECPLLRPRLTGETVRVEEDWFVRQDGSLVSVAYSSAPVPLPDGRGAVVSFRSLR